MKLQFMITAAFLFLPLCAQEKKDTSTLPIPDPTNLKILKVTTGVDVGQIMRTFSSGLGVQCSYCHIEGNFASDDNPKKESARQMVKLIQKINTDFPDGKMHVSCYTCHRGEAVPKTAPEPKPG
jgi:hypothetical protein